MNIPLSHTRVKLNYSSGAGNLGKMDEAKSGFAEAAKLATKTPKMMYEGFRGTLCHAIKFLLNWKGGINGHPDHAIF
ncbi:MAG TPA: hypothetical protein VKR32_01295 [Puia sp.]|nr:hypothetical protein [Puia sp.]